jgi:HEAT repeat protein
MPSEREAAVRAALDSGHPGLAHAGLAAIQLECSAYLVDRVGAIAADRNGDEMLRVLAARALGRCTDRRALASLIALADGGRTLLGRARLAPRSGVMLAALEALTTGWRSDARASALIRLAGASSDAEIRRAATQGAP